MWSLLSLDEPWEGESLLLLSNTCLYKDPLRLPKSLSPIARPHGQSFTHQACVEGLPLMGQPMVLSVHRGIRGQRRGRQAHRTNGQLGGWRCRFSLEGGQRGSSEKLTLELQVLICVFVSRE